MIAGIAIDTSCREVVEIDALIRALRNQQHWAAVAHVRRERCDDWGMRLHATAARLHEQAWAGSLDAAYRLFEIDGLRSGGLP